MALKLYLKHLIYSLKDLFHLPPPLLIILVIGICLVLPIHITLSAMITTPMRMLGAPHIQRSKF